MDRQGVGAQAGEAGRLVHLVQAVGVEAEQVGRVSPDELACRLHGAVVVSAYNGGDASVSSGPLMGVGNSISSVLKAAVATANGANADPQCGAFTPDPDRVPGHRPSDEIRAAPLTVIVSPYGSLLVGPYERTSPCASDRRVCVMTVPKSLGTPRSSELPATSSRELFSRVNVGRISGLIVDQVRLLLKDGQLTPGDRLPSERDLCERFGVSRVTVREALRVLEAKGLIRIKVGAHGGAFITAPTSERVGEGIADLLVLSTITATEVTEARRVFELGIVPLVCERADEEDVRDLLEICDRSDRALAAGTYSMSSSGMSLSAEFHVRVARATHKAVIEMLVQSFHGPMLMSLRRVQLAAPLVGRVGTGEHRTFAEAIARQDEAAATAVMSAHLARTAERLKTAGDDEVLPSSSA